MLGSNRSSLPAAAVDAFAGLLVLSAAADAYSLRRYWSVCLPLPLPALPPAVSAPELAQLLLAAMAAPACALHCQARRALSPAVSATELAQLLLAAMAATACALRSQAR